VCIYVLKFHTPLVCRKKAHDEKVANEITCYEHSTSSITGGDIALLDYQKAGCESSVKDCIEKLKRMAAQKTAVEILLRKADEIADEELLPLSEEKSKEYQRKDSLESLLAQLLDSHTAIKNEIAELDAQIKDEEEESQNHPS